MVCFTRESPKAKNLPGACDLSSNGANDVRSRAGADGELRLKANGISPAYGGAARLVRPDSKAAAAPNRATSDGPSATANIGAAATTNIITQLRAKTMVAGGTEACFRGHGVQFMPAFVRNMWRNKTVDCLNHAIIETAVSGGNNSN